MNNWLKALAMLGILVLMAPEIARWVAHLFAFLQWGGDLLSPSHLKTSTKLFRFGLISGGMVSTACLARVAWKDRDGRYAAVAALVAVVLCGIVLTGTLPAATPGLADGEPARARLEQGIPGIEIARYEHWQAFSANGEDILHQYLRALARGRDADAAQLDARLVAMKGSAPRLQRKQSEFQQLAIEYEKLNGDSFRRRDASEQIQFRVESHRLLIGMHEAWPDNARVLRTLGSSELTLLRLKVLEELDLESAWETPLHEIPGTATQLLADARARYLGAILLEPEVGAAFTGYAQTWIDDDEELAYGALLAAEAKDEANSTGLQIHKIQLELMGRMFPRATWRRLEILMARAEVASAGEGIELPAHATQPPPLPPIGRGAEGVIELPSAPAAPPGGDGLAEARETMQLVMPKAEAVSSGMGLRVRSDEPFPEAGIAAGERGTVIEGRVDFEAAGVTPESRFAPSAWVTESISAVSTELDLDVLADGTVTAVLVRASSGDDGLDSAARSGARSWRFVPAKEDRRVRVVVVFPQTRLTRLEAGVGDPRLKNRAPAQDEAYNRRFMPNYPPSTARDEVDRTVLVRVRITAAGRVSHVNIERSSRDRAVDRAALAAVRQWRFHPALVDGELVESVAIVPVTFMAGP